MSSQATLAEEEQPPHDLIRHAQRELERPVPEEGGFDEDEADWEEAEEEEDDDDSEDEYSENLMAASSLENKRGGDTEDDGVPYLLCHMVEESFTSLVPSIAASAVWGRMNSLLWGQLPEAVLDQILLDLPATSQARFRAVSKRWLHLLTSSQFQKQSAALAFHARHAVCIMEYMKPGDEEKDAASGVDRNLFNRCLPRAHKVHRLGLGFLPPECLAGDFQLGTPISQSGLLCVAKTGDQHHYRIFIANPATRTWLELPAIGLEEGCVDIFLMSSEPGGHFRVTLTCNNSFSFFSSTAGVWFVSSTRYADHLRLHDSYNFIVGKRWAYTQMTKFLTGECGDSELHLFCVGTGELVHTLPVEMKEVDGGKLGLLDRDRHGSDETLLTVAPVAGGLRVWRLLDTGCGWETLATMPPGLLDGVTSSLVSYEWRDGQVFELRHGKDFVVEVEDVKVATDVVFICYSHDYLGLVKDYHLLAYHIGTNIWRRLFCSDRKQRLLFHELRPRMSASPAPRVDEDSIPS